MTPVGLPVPRLPSWRTLADGALALSGPPAAAAATYGVVLAHRIYHPPRVVGPQTPADAGLPYEGVTIPARRDGVTLDAWLVPADAGAGTVVLGHGMGRNKATVLRYAAMLHDAGLNVLAFDLRNHGRSGSDGAVTGMAGRFIDDFDVVVSHVASRPELAGGGIALFCFSFSTWPALQVAVTGAARVQAVVCDSGPAMDVAASFHRVMDVRKGTLPPPLRGPVLYELTKAVYARAAERMLAATGWPPALGARDVPMLFVAGDADPVIPPGEVERVAAVYPGSQLWVAPGASHLQAFRAHPERYRDLVTGFLLDALARRPAGEAAP